MKVKIFIVSFLVIASLVDLALVVNAPFFNHTDYFSWQMGAIKTVGTWGLLASLVIILITTLFFKKNKTYEQRKKDKTILRIAIISVSLVVVVYVVYAVIAAKEIGNALECMKLREQGEECVRE